LADLYGYQPENFKRSKNPQFQAHPEITPISGLFNDDELLRTVKQANGEERARRLEEDKLPFLSLERGRWTR
jgi:hypothetical protein